MSEKKISPTLQQALGKLKGKNIDLEDLPTDRDAPDWNLLGKAVGLETLELIALKSHRLTIQQQDVPVEEFSFGIPYQSNGINFASTWVLPRADIVRKAFEQLSSLQFLVVGAPPAYGKTSLLQLLEREGKKKGFWVKRFLLNETFSDQDFFDEFERNTGIDLGQKAIVDKCPGTMKLMLIDEAHSHYSREVFWNRVIKFFPGWDGSQNYRFVFAVTYNLSIKGSPVAFTEPSVGRLTAEEMLLKDEEGEMFWTLLLQSANLHGWLSFRQLYRTIVLDSGGQAGAIIAAFLYLKSKYELQKAPLEEEELLQLLFGRQYLKMLNRIFSVPSFVSKDVKKMLTSVYSHGKKPFSFPTQESPDKMILRQLIQGGVLKGEEADNGDQLSFEFATPLGKRFFYEYLFNNRADMGTEVKCVGDLVLHTVAKMSAKMLSDAAMSSTATEKFPKEAAFQQFFLSALTTNLPITATVCPEMSQIWGKAGEKIEGEVDFYINGDLKYGIELLIKGAGVGEHRARFGKGGKYERLGAKQHLVVDFRPMAGGVKTKVRKKPDLMTIFFSEDYLQAEYVWDHKEGNFGLSA